MANKAEEVNIGLLDIVDLKFLQEIQDAFAKSANVASIMVDNNGPITQPSNFTDFCIKYTRGCETGYKRCNECDIKWGKLASEKGEPVIYDCHTGLTDFAVPIMLNGKHIASILGGQILTHPPNIEHFKKIAKEIGINENEYIEAVKKINIVPLEQVKAAAELMYVVANTISELAHKKYELLQKSQRDAILNKIIDRIRNKFNTEEIKQYLINTIGEYFDADRCFFVDYDKTTNKFLPIKLEVLKSTKIRSLIGLDAEKELPEFCTKLRNKKKNIIIRDIEKTIARKSLISHKALNSLLKNNTKSDYVLLLQYEDQIVGILVLHFIKNKRILSNEELSFLRTIQHHVGLAIYQNMLIEEKKQIAQNEKTIRKIIEITRSSLDSNEVKKQVVNALGKAFKADRCYFRAYDKSQDKFFPPDVEYLSSPDIKSLLNIEPNQEGLRYFSGELRKRVNGFYPVIATEEEAKGTPLETYMKAAEMKADYAMPIIDDDEGFTWLVLHYSDEDPKFDDDYKKLLETIAFQVDISLKQIRLYNKAQQQIEREKLLRNITETIRITQDIDKILSFICTEAAKLFNVQRAIIVEFPDEQNDAYTQKKEYKSRDDIKSFADTSYAKNANNHTEKNLFATNDLLVYDNISKADIPEAFKKFYESTGLKSAIGSVVKKGKKRWGAIILFEYNNYRHWSDEEITLLKTISDQIYISINQAELYSEIKQQAEREKAILSTLPFMVWLKDKDSRLLAVNETYAKMCATTIENIIGKTDYDFFPKEDADLYVADDKEVMKLGKTKSVEEVIQGSDGTRWHETYKTPLFDEKGEVIGTTGFSRDITDRKEVEKIKNEFVSTVSHELRTPLTSLSGAIELILSGKMGEFSDKIKSLLNMAHNNSVRLTNLINDILDIEKIEAGKMDFEIKPFELMPLINQAIQLNLQFAQKFNVEIKLMEALSNVFVQVDSNRLIQVLTNLLSNAIKFSEPNAFVELAVFRINDNVRISVTNYGAEIPQSFKNKIFQKFAQADSSDSRQKGGTGLGLNISKLIVEKMNGQINFVSENNKTTFYFDLPEFTDKQRGIIDDKTSVNM